MKLQARLSVGAVTLMSGTMTKSTYGYVGARHLTVLMHRSAAFKWERRLPDSDRLQCSLVEQRRIHILEAAAPFWNRYHARPSFFAFVLGEDIVKQVWEQAFTGVGAYGIGTSADLEDPVIERLCDLGERELRCGGGDGRLYVEGLATALTVHLLRSYGRSCASCIRHTGGLTPRQLRRVLDFIQANLNGDLSLTELAAVTELSTHHFGQAFKAATGKPPHFYVIERRVDRARELLQQGERSIADIALAVGFSSQSHLTLNFRKVIGTTPAQFRRSLE